MKRVAAGLLMLFGACGPYWTRGRPTDTHPGRITVCLSLPGDQLPAAHDAVTMWDTTLGNWKHMIAVDNPKDDNVCTITVRTTTRTVDTDGTTLAWCSCVGCSDIYMRIGFYEQDVTGILEHELGHAMGAQHYDGTLMDPHWDRGKYRCPDRVTVMQVAEWNHIDESLLTWCYF